MAVFLVLAPAAPALAQKGGGPAKGKTGLTFRSDPGDYIGQGVTQTWTPTNGSFTATHGSGLVTVSYSGGSTSWTLNFKARSGLELIPGPYAGATRYPFQSPSTPGLDVSGSGRACNTLTGRFDVLEAVYAADGSVSRFAADFEQHCEGATAALRGNGRYNASPSSCRRPTTTGTASPPPPTTARWWRTPPRPMRTVTGSATPASLTFRSDPGDYIGGGLTQTWTPANGTFTASHSTGRVTTRFEGGSTWWTSTSRRPTAGS